MFSSLWKYHSFLHLVWITFSWAIQLLRKTILLMFLYISSSSFGAVGRYAWQWRERARFDSSLCRRCTNFPRDFLFSLSSYFYIVVPSLYAALRLPRRHSFFFFNVLVVEKQSFSHFLFFLSHSPFFSLDRNSSDEISIRWNNRWMMNCARITCFISLSGRCGWVLLTACHSVWKICSKSLQSFRKSSSNSDVIEHTISNVEKFRICSAHMSGTMNCVENLCLRVE